MAYDVRSKLKEKHVARYVEAVRRLLVDGEEIQAIFWANCLRPMINAVVITNVRVMGVSRADLHDPAKAVRQVLTGTDIALIEIADSRLGPTNLKITTANGERYMYGQVQKADTEALRRDLEAIRGVASPVAEAVARRADEADAAEDELQNRIIGKVGGKALEEIRKSCRSGELPQFVIGEGSAGSLAAFKDRCIIVKRGAIAGFMSGSLGGGRVTTFPYRQVTGVEYNSGWVSGVLEILTPSYQGSANKDYWRGTLKSRNANANDPWTLSNCLPMPKPNYERARAQIEQLRGMVATAHQPAAMQAPPPPAELSSELAKLAELHSQGALDDEEFKQAKQALIAKVGGG